MVLKVYPDNPQEKSLQKIVEVLNKGGVVILPTDTVYAIACSVNEYKAFERICKIKGVKPEDSNFSFLFNDLSHISDYTKPFANNIFKVMKKALPGPFTFILNAGNKIPSRYFGSKSSKKTIGIRVPDNNILRQVVLLMEHPLISTSVHDDDEVLEYTTDPELIFERYEGKVDLVIDGGIGGNIPSTVIDCSTDEPLVLREGKGESILVL